MNSRGFEFSDVDVVLADSLPASRNTLRTILADLGFRRVVTCSSVEQVRTVIQDSPIDLLIADTELPEGDSCRFIHGIRHGLDGGDPFLPVLSTTWHPTEEIVQKAVGAGVDAFLTLPASLESMKESLAKVVSMRKPFVVTSDYIGPDRRKNLRGQGQKIPLIDVPNPVRAKALGSREKVNHQGCVDFINEQKVERHVYAIGYLLKSIARDPDAGGGEESVEDQFQRLRDIAVDLVSRIRSSRYSEYSEQCRALIPVVEGLELGNEKKKKQDLEHLTQMALAIDFAIHADEQCVETSVCAA